MLAQSPPRSLISHNSYVTVLTTTAVFAIVFYFQSFAMAAEPADVTFSTAFEGGSLGRIEKVNDTTFRVHVLGQQDERGRNRAATWYCFRMDHVKGRDLTITITDFIGEYNDVPGSVPMNEKIRPAMSEDGRSWSHAEDMTWDKEKKEATIRLKPKQDSVWLATQPMYTHSRLIPIRTATTTSRPRRAPGSRQGTALATTVGPTHRTAL